MWTGKENIARQDKSKKHIWSYAESGQDVTHA